MLERSEQFLAGGVSSSGRLSQRPWPIFFERGAGARLYDAAVAFTERPCIRDYREHVENCDRERYADFAFSLLARGVRVASRGIWYLSTAHTAHDIEVTLEAVEGALQDTFTRR
jgi:glutamate-1-semialdehyde aminotransferase